MRELFPVLGTNEMLPFAALAKYENQARNNHGQTLDRLAERGGCNWLEIRAIVEGWNPWRETSRRYHDADNRVVVLRALGLNHGVFDGVNRLWRYTPVSSGENE